MAVFLVWVTKKGNRDEIKAAIEMPLNVIITYEARRSQNLLAIIVLKMNVRCADFETGFVNQFYIIRLFLGVLKNTYFYSHTSRKLCRRIKIASSLILKDRSKIFLMKLKN